MSWFERRRRRALAAFREEAALDLGSGLDHQPGRSLDRQAEEATDLVAEQAAPVAIKEPAVEGSDWLPTIRVSRAGHYLIADATGVQVGTILGDYVVGFTVRCWDLNRHFTDLESAMSAIAHEAQARAAARLLKAS